MAQEALIDGNLINDDRPLAVEQRGYSGQAVAGAVGDVDLPAVNTPAVITYAGVPGLRHVISGIAWSYMGGAPAAGSIVVTDAGAVVFALSTTSQGADQVTFPQPKMSAAVNTAMVITLAAGGGAVTGSLSILNHWTEP